MTAICSENDMPTPRMVRMWCEDDKDVASAVLYSRELGYDAIAEQCFSIADDSTGDLIEDEKGNTRLNHEFAARAKIRIETRLKLLAKWSKRYSDQPASQQINVAVGVTVMTPERLADLQARKKASILRNRARNAKLSAPTQGTPEIPPES